MTCEVICCGKETDSTILGIELCEHHENQHYNRHIDLITKKGMLTSNIPNIEIIGCNS